MTRLAEDTAWMAQAACIGKNPALFFPVLQEPPPAQMAIVRTICGDCPVRRDCLTYALGYQRYGIWGGLTPRERRALARTACPSGHRLPIALVVVMLLARRQHTHCRTCGQWVELVLPGEKHRRNGWVTGTGMRT